MKKTAISFAQFEEDIVLLNALAEVEKNDIYYIDVGANDAIWSSATFLLYLLGAKGINIEPQEEYKDKYVRFRPRDISLFIGVGNKRADMEMRGKGQSATFDLNGKYAKGSNRIVHIETLRSICAENISSEQDIHILKIDVEGYERQVIEGMDFDTYRPWIICIESYKPGEVQESYLEWEHYLNDFGYKYAYTRGANRYYCCCEKDNIFKKLCCSSVLDTEYEIIKMGDYESLINSKLFRYSALIRKALYTFRRLFSL